MELTEYQRRALEILRARTSKNPITGKEVANQIGLKPRTTGKEGADMRSVINALRVKGYPICATGSGYWWPKDRIELDGYIASFQGRIDDQQRACDGLKESKKHLEDIDVPERELRYVIYNPGGGISIVKVMESQLREFLTKHPKALPYK